VRSRRLALGLRAGDDRPGLFRSFDALMTRWPDQSGLTALA
jgi:hypothetical protein